MSFKIEKVHAFIVDDPEGEGVVAFYNPTVGWMPMIGADQTRLDELKKIAQDLANQQKKEIKLIFFSVREEIEVIKPE